MTSYPIEDFVNPIRKDFGKRLSDRQIFYYFDITWNISAVVENVVGVAYLGVQAT